MDKGRPDRLPDVVLPNNNKECEVECWVEENIFAIGESYNGDHVHSSVMDGTCYDVKAYLDATLKHYEEDDPRCLAILAYYLEQELLR